AARARHRPDPAPRAGREQRLRPDLASSPVRPRALRDRSRCRGLSQQVVFNMKSIFGIVLRPMVTLVTTAIAIAVGYALWDYYVNAPWTRDGKVRADVVAVAPDVSGLVTEVLVHDNQRVRKGDVLFKIDPDRFDLALRQAEAIVAGKQASLEQAESDYQRYDKLSDNAVSQQRLELAKAVADEARAAYDQ